MDQEKLKTCNAISKEIEVAEMQLDYWKSATRLQNSGVLIVYQSPSGNRSYDQWVTVSPETFTIVKALNIAHFTEKVEALKKQFEEL
jgi:hypothetical protein